MDKKYLVYQVINRFDGKIYIGVHSTINKNDRYMGSGVEIKEALKKYGRKSFIKEILFEYDTKEEMLAKEKELVTREFCMRTDTYNRIEGGGVYCTEGRVAVKDKDNNNFSVYSDDPRYLSGELVGVAKGKSVVKDYNGNIFQIDVTDSRYISGELKNRQSGIAVVKDKNGNVFQVDKNDERLLSGELVGCMKGLPGNKQFLGKFHSKESKNKQSEKAKLRIGDKNSSFGTMWIMKEGKNKKIKKKDFDDWQNQGWIKGRIKIDSIV